MLAALKNNAIIMFLSFALGVFVTICVGYTWFIPEPETIYELVYLDRIEYIDRMTYEQAEPEIRTITVYKESEVVEVPTYQSLRDFESFEILQAWLDKNGGFVYVIPDSGTVTFGEADDNNDCDDQARRLQEKAFKDGYNLSLHLIDKDGYLMGKKVTDGKLPHMGNLAVIGNDIYYVDGIGKEAIWISCVD
jgi:hypothetical protein